jgi:hypothetical protein
MAEPFQAGDRYSRDQVLQQRISRTVLTSAKDADRYRTDMAMHLQVKVLRDVLLLTDKAMEAEGVVRAVRDRIMHWILVGEQPPGWEEDPDKELEQAVQEKMAAQAALIRHLENLPVSNEFLADLANPIRLEPRATPVRDRGRGDG